MKTHDCLTTRHADHGCVECDAEQRRGTTMNSDDRSFIAKVAEAHLRGMAEISGWGSHRVNAMLSDLHRLSEQPEPSRVSEDAIHQTAGELIQELRKDRLLADLTGLCAESSAYPIVIEAMRSLVGNRYEKPRDMQALAERIARTILSTVDGSGTHVKVIVRDSANGEEWKATRGLEWMTNAVRRVLEEADR